MNFRKRKAKQRRFLGALRDGADLVSAATLSGVSDSTVRRWRRSDKAFEAQVAQAVTNQNTLPMKGNWIPRPANDTRFMAMRKRGGRLKGVRREV